MKTKVNEVPLVGPRGRKELLKRIGKLEESGSGKPQALVVEGELVEDDITMETKFIPKNCSLQDAFNAFNNNVPVYVRFFYADSGLYYYSKVTTSFDDAAGDFGLIIPRFQGRQQPSIIIWENEV